MEKNKKVLVIDDSLFIFKAVKRALEPDGFEVVDNAVNGKIGIEMVAKYQPCVITLDVTMPVMDGIETAKHLFRTMDNPKVVMLSAMGNDKLIAEAKEIGIRHFVVKPFKSEELLNAVNDLLKND